MRWVPHDLISPLITAARPKTLTASISPVLIGIGIAISKTPLKTSSCTFSMCTVALLILITAMLIQVLTNYVNDLWDFKKGSDTKLRTGPERVVFSGKVSEQKMASAIKILTGIILALGSILVYFGGIPVLVIGLLSILGAYAYTAGPYPLAHNGLGELFVLIFFGPVAVMGTEYLLLKEFSLEAFLLGTACGFLATAILIVNNTRDIGEDRTTGKRTLAARYGRDFATFEFGTCLFFAYAAVLITPLFTEISNYTVLISLNSLLSFYVFWKFLKAEKGDDFNKLLPLTGSHLFIFSLILSILVLL